MFGCLGPQASVLRGEQAEFQCPVFHFRMFPLGRCAAKRRNAPKSAQNKTVQTAPTSFAEGLKVSPEVRLRNRAKKASSEPRHLRSTPKKRKNILRMPIWDAENAKLRSFASKAPLKPLVIKETWAWQDLKA